MLIFLLAACVGPFTAPDMYMAETAEWTFDPDTFCLTLGCGFDEVDEILDVIPEVDGVVEVVSTDPTLFTLHAKTAGDTLVAVSGLAASAEPTAARSGARALSAARAAIAGADVRAVPSRSTVQSPGGRARPDPPAGRIH